jgi:catechol 2,3-dioxygenase-like lactoylglutathione lyase family enzyme
MTHLAKQSLKAAAQLFEASGSEITEQGVVEIICVDLDPMLEFYLDLGFRIERQSDSFAVLCGYSIRLFLEENPKASTGKRWVNIRLLVANIDLVRKYVREIGIACTEEIADRSYGIRDFTVADPSGLDIRFAQVM